MTKYICENCNKEVNGEDEICPHCSYSFSDVKCPKCGHIGNNLDFKNGCIKCNHNKNDNIKENQSKNTSFYVKINKILFIIFVILMLFTIKLFFI